MYDFLGQKPLCIFVVFFSRTKLGVSTAQVQDQSAYVKQLISTDADPSLIEQEKLVERQLKKRMVKSYRK
jgi:hypothetical protein